jgi:arylesterase/paraoxonase
VRICGCMRRLGISTWLAQTLGRAWSGCPRLTPFTSVLRPSINISSIDHLNATGRGVADRIAVLATRASGRLASRIHWLSIENFPGTNGDGLLNLHGMDIRADDNTGVLRILLVNHRPPIDPITGEGLDATKVGANSTVEQFQTTIGSSSMHHVRTYHHDVIQTPNRVAWVSDHSFVFTNDHTYKVGVVSISLTRLMNAFLTLPASST